MRVISLFKTEAFSKIWLTELVFISVWILSTRVILYPGQQKSLSRNTEKAFQFKALYVMN
ncbi:hypothetical protein AYY16_10375 [Morganella psychrotolerans]|nr:hypothetical protein AYY16_10375 [Morganella psychrotolerans]